MHYNGESPNGNSTMELRCKINSYGFGRDFTDWVKREVMRLKIELHSLSRDDREHELLIAVNGLLSKIKEHDPSDPRAFAEKQLTRMRFDREIVEMTQDVFSLAPEDEKAAQSLEDAVERFIRRAEREFPLFREDHEGVMMGFLSALRTQRSEGVKRRVTGPEPAPGRAKKPVRTST
jgi:hypothetical protein